MDGPRAAEPLPVERAELVLSAVSTVLAVALSLAVAVACFRRCRHLSGYSVPHSMLVALAAGLVPVVWIVVWAVNKDRTDAEWHRHRRGRATADLL
ncbi:hypothetical protein [Aeromicrobium massiliense]|uniref:hypothetical protein n=1 Tax=Aeromicrobium massiliense TaxID=1464554 RepID=UPI0003000128|nr:hypothetical protein [Aeromicrobium massiliense]